MFINQFVKDDIEDICLLLKIVSDEQEFKKNISYTKMFDCVEILKLSTNEVIRLYDFSVVDVIKFYDDPSSVLTDERTEIYNKYMDNRFHEFYHTYLKDFKDKKEALLIKYEELSKTNTKYMNKLEKFQLANEIKHTWQQIEDAFKISGEVLLNEKLKKMAEQAKILKDKKVNKNISTK